MARFDRQNTERSELAASLETATEELRLSVERELREIVETAKAQAKEIEREAGRRAAVLDRESEKRAEERLRASFGHVWALLDAVDLIEATLGSMVGALRAELEDLATELTRPLQAEDEAEITAPPAAAQALAGQQAGEPATPPVAAVEPAAVPDASVAEPAPAPTPEVPNLEVRQMIYEQIVAMFRDGKARSDAERFVTRFKSGEDYLPLVEQVYNMQEAARGAKPRMRRRLRRRGR